MSAYKVNPVNWKPRTYPMSSDRKYWTPDFNWIQYLNDVNDWWRVFNEIMQENLPEDFLEVVDEDYYSTYELYEYSTDLEGTINMVLERIKR